MRKSFIKPTSIIPLIELDDIIDFLLEDEKRIRCGRCRRYGNQNNLFVVFDCSMKIRCKRCL